MKTWFADHTNPDNLRGSASDALVGADVFIGLSGPGVVTVDDLGKMNREPIVFAMANPTPEIMPEEAARYVRVMATGRSDYPNQINNSCGFPGIFRGLFDVRARRVNDEMKLAAAHALASIVADSELERGVHHPVDVRPARGAGRRLRRGRRRRAHGSGPPQARLATSEGGVPVRPEPRVPTERRAGPGTPSPRDTLLRGCLLATQSGHGTDVGGFDYPQKIRSRGEGVPGPTRRRALPGSRRGSGGGADRRSFVASVRE